MIAGTRKYHHIYVCVNGCYFSQNFKCTALGGQVFNKTDLDKAIHITDVYVQPVVQAHDLSDMVTQGF